MSTYTTRIRPTGHSIRLGYALKRFLPPISLKRGALFGSMIFIALVAFEVFNYSTTEFAFTDLLSDLRFAGIRWSTILALAFCGMDFAGIARLLTPERGEEKPMESWYLLGAWLLAATMNAILTWWAVSLALLNHQALGNEIVSRETLLNSVPVFVAILVWLIRILMIGSFTLAGPRLFSQDDSKTISFPLPMNSGIRKMQTSSRDGNSGASNNRPIRPAPKSPNPVMRDPRA
jgi:hypothetical protein